MSIKEKLQQYATAAPTAPSTHTASVAADEQRKARTHRLVQVGAIADQYLETVGCAPEDVELLLQKLVQLSEVQKVIKRKK